jgi:hypothetical protein
MRRFMLVKRTSLCFSTQAKNRIARRAIAPLPLFPFPSTSPINEALSANSLPLLVTAIYILFFLFSLVFFSARTSSFQLSTPKPCEDETGTVEMCGTLDLGIAAVEGVVVKRPSHLVRLSSLSSPSVCPSLPFLPLPPFFSAVICVRSSPSPQSPSY